MKKHWILIVMLFVVASCNEQEIPNGEKDDDEVEVPGIVDTSLSLSGSIQNLNWDDLGASAFKVQLIEGEVDFASFIDNYTYTHPNAQVFVTERSNNNNFEFNHLREGMYSLIVSKRGYRASSGLIEIQRNNPNMVRVRMERDENSGFTGRLQILGEDGNDLSEIRINRNSTLSVFFYLFNGTGSNQAYSITSRHNEGWLMGNFIIDGRVQTLQSNWVKEIKPRGGTLRPNEIQLIEVVICPVVYLLREHSRCDILINWNQDLRIEISY